MGKVFAFCLLVTPLLLHGRAVQKSGTVYVSFRVDRNGAATGHKVLKGSDPKLDAEVLPVVRLLDGWWRSDRTWATGEVQNQFPFKSISNRL